MLVLTRRPGEGILIGEDIEIRISRIDGDTVKLGIKAPRNVSIYRDEIYRQMTEVNRIAAWKSGDSVPSLKVPALANLSPPKPKADNSR